MIWFAYVVGALVLFKLYQKWTCGTCTSNAILAGQVAIVTGANTGIGYETARELAKRGARVILACRDPARGSAACARIARDTSADPSRLLYKHLDLASLASVRRFASDVLASERRLDILVNNAGTGGVNNKRTPDGIVVEMQINHFAPFLLTNLLSPLLKKTGSSRVVTVASLMHWFGKVDLERIGEPRTTALERARVYCDSKLCNVLFSLELSRRATGSGVVANSLHPGFVNTETFRSLPGPVLATLRALLPYVSKSPREGAQTSVWCAVSEEAGVESGRFYSECAGGLASPAARDAALARSLWDVSARLVRLAPDEPSF